MSRHEKLLDNFCPGCYAADCRINTTDYDVCGACGHIYCTYVVGSLPPQGSSTGTDNPKPNRTHWEAWTKRQSELYSHAYHANERDKQWQMCEPKIPKQHMAQIYEAAARLYPEDHLYHPGAHGNLGASDKAPYQGWGQAEVRAILRSIGKEFVKRYLEKWRTILFKITRQPREIPSDDLVNAMHRDFVLLSVPMLEYTLMETAPNGQPKHNLRPLDSIYLVLLVKHGQLQAWKNDFYMIKSPKKFKEFMGCMEYSFKYVQERCVDPVEKQSWDWVPLTQDMFELKPTFKRDASVSGITPSKTPKAPKTIPKKRKHPVEDGTQAQPKRRSSVSVVLKAYGPGLQGQDTHQQTSRPETREYPDGELAPVSFGP